MTTAKHYDEEYRAGDYSARYERLPEWAVAMNRWHVDFTIALLGLSPDAGPILDLGSGVGHYLSAWESRGYKTQGREISEVAILKSGRTNIDCGDATDLTDYGDNSFQLIFSAAFLEHVDDQQVSRMLWHEMRVARYAAHFIAHDKGNDEGHINIKTPQAWQDFFSAKGMKSLCVPNPLVPVQPAFLHMHILPAHIEHTIQTYFGGSQ